MKSKHLITYTFSMVLYLSVSSMIMAQQNALPNFVIIMADDCTYHDLEIYGGQAKTPYLKEIAKQSFVFQNCFQPTAMCAPTRMSLLTGLYPVRHGGYYNHSKTHDTIQSIAQYLQNAGYRTALSGKRHIQPQSVFPFEYSDNKSDPDFQFIEDFISSSIDEKTPFCLFAMCSSPHVPWTKGDPDQYDRDQLVLPPYLIDTKETRDAFSQYLAEITHFDSQVAKLDLLLKKKNIVDNTVFIVLSEHGSVFPFEKWTCYDAGLKSGMLIRYPALNRTFQSVDALVEYTDIVPTLLDLANAQSTYKLDGKSFLPLLKNEKQQHKSLVYGIQTTLGIHEAKKGFGIRSVRSEQYKLIVNLFPENEFQNAVLMNPEKWTPVRQSYLGWMTSWYTIAKENKQAALILNRYKYRPAIELYDIQEDPFELKNLATDWEYQPIVNALSGHLENWMIQQKDEGRNTELNVPLKN